MTKKKPVYVFDGWQPEDPPFEKLSAWLVKWFNRELFEALKDFIPGGDISIPAHGPIKLEYWGGGEALNAGPCRLSIDALTNDIIDEMGDVLGLFPKARAIKVAKEFERAAKRLREAAK